MRCQLLRIPPPPHTHTTTTTTHLGLIQLELLPTAVCAAADIPLLQMLEMYQAKAFSSFLRATRSLPVRRASEVPELPNSGHRTCTCCNH
jgi:hypothetical protein